VNEREGARGVAKRIFLGQESPEGSECPFRFERDVSLTRTSHEESCDDVSATQTLHESAAAVNEPEP